MSLRGEVMDEVQKMYRVFGRRPRRVELRPETAHALMEESADLLKYMMVTAKAFPSDSSYCSFLAQLLGVEEVRVSTSRPSGPGGGAEASRAAAESRFADISDRIARNEIVWKGAATFCAASSGTPMAAGRGEFVVPATSWSAAERVAMTSWDVGGAAFDAKGNPVHVLSVVT